MSRPRIAVVAALPPPVHGMTLVNEFMVGALERHFTIHLAPLASSRRGDSLPTAKGASVLRACLRLAQWRKVGTRILYLVADGGWGLLFTAGIAGFGRALGYRVVVHHHSFAYVREKSRLMSFIDDCVGYTGGLHIHLCERMARQFAAKYRFGSCHTVINNAASVSAMAGPANRMPPAGDALVLMHLSNISVEKGLLVILDTFAELRRAGHNVRLILAGPAVGEREAAAINTATQHYPNDVQWIGPVAGSEKAALLSQADIFLFPSDYVNEACPLVVMEALKEGCFVLATDRGCIPEMLNESAGLSSPLSEFKAHAIRVIVSALQDLPSFRDGRDLRRAMYLDMLRDSGEELKLLVRRLMGSSVVGAGASR